MKRAQCKSRWNPLSLSVIQPDLEVSNTSMEWLWQFPHYFSGQTSTVKKWSGLGRGEGGKRVLDVHGPHYVVVSPLTSHPQSPKWSKHHSGTGPLVFITGCCGLKSLTWWWSKAHFPTWLSFCFRTLLLLPSMGYNNPYFT